MKMACTGGKDAGKASKFVESIDEFEKVGGCDKCGRHVAVDPLETAAGCKQFCDCKTGADSVKLSDSVKKVISKVKVPDTCKCQEAKINAGVSVSPLASFFIIAVMGAALLIEHL